MSKTLIKKLEQIAEAARQERFDINRGKKFHDAASQKAVPGLSKLWYENQAHQFVHDYGKEIEDGWEEKAVNSFCNAYKFSSGIEIDREKLIEAIKTVLKKRQDSFLEVKPVSLKEISRSLRQEALVEERLEKVIKSSAGDLLTEAIIDNRLSLNEYREYCGTRCDENTLKILDDRFAGKRMFKPHWDHLYDEADMGC
jgi:hypothetical protein